jgi:amidophosphoribosyltransferase
MCGVIGVVSNTAANQLLYDGLMVLQHRGQDAAGIVTAEESRFHMHKGQGLARDVFRTRDMRNLLGDMGVAHVRHPTAGSASSSAESQPFYVNSPYGIVLGHNGSHRNLHELKESLFRSDLRHVNTNRIPRLLAVLAYELQVRARRGGSEPGTISARWRACMRAARALYAVTASSPATASWLSVTRTAFARW